MSIENSISGNFFDCQLSGGDSKILEFMHDSGTKIELKNLECNGFSEDGALVQKVRVHSTLEQFSATGELNQIIPFGSEFAVKRSFDFADGFVRVIVDVDPGAGAIEDLKLEDFEITGSFTKLKLFQFSGSKVELNTIELSENHEIYYDKDKPILAFNVIDRVGNEFEYGCGNDLWRHFGADLYPNCSAEFKLSGNSKKLLLERRIIKFATTEDAPRKRAWRFKYYFAWNSVAKDIDDKTEDYFEVSVLKLVKKKRPNEIINATDLCMSDALTRRVIRKFIRTANSSLLLNADLNLCKDSRHLERSNSNELLHWGIDDFFEVAIWGNKSLAQKNFKLKFKTLDDNIFSELVALKVLSNVLSNSIKSQ